MSDPIRIQYSRKDLCLSVPGRWVAVLLALSLAGCKPGGDDGTLVHDNYSATGLREEDQPLPGTVTASHTISKGGLHVVASGETPWTVAQQYNVPLRDLIELNRLEAPFRLVAGQTLQLPVMRLWTVQAGDTLYDISRRFGLDQHRLAAANRLASPWALTPGQVLRLPAPVQPVLTEIPVTASRISDQVPATVRGLRYVLVQGDTEEDGQMVLDGPPEYADYSGADQAPAARFAPMVGLPAPGPLEEPRPGQRLPGRGQEGRGTIGAFVQPPLPAKRPDIEAARDLARKRQSRDAGAEATGGAANPRARFAGTGRPEQDLRLVAVDDGLLRSLGLLKESGDAKSGGNRDGRDWRGWRSEPAVGMAGAAGPELPEWPRLTGDFLIRIQEKPEGWTMEAREIALPAPRPESAGAGAAGSGTASVGALAESRVGETEKAPALPPARPAGGVRASGTEERKLAAVIPLPAVKPQQFRKEPELAIPTHTPPRSRSTFLWPVRGEVLETYGPTEDGRHNDGINIAAVRGTDVKATENGIVVYTGDELRGFGNLVLIRHADRWMSAYAHVDGIKVRKGEEVRRGQIIARVGQSGAVSSPQLHFELRRGTNAVNPERYLGRTSNVASAP